MKTFTWTVAACALMAMLAGGCNSTVNTGEGDVAPTDSAKGAPSSGLDTPAQKPELDDKDDHGGAEIDDDGKEGAEGDDNDEKDDKDDKPNEGEVVPVAYRDANGQLLCPVMGATIESEAKAIGHQDYKGVRYYFCCGDCPKLFAKDPEKWLKTQN